MDDAVSQALEAWRRCVDQWLGVIQRGTDATQAQIQLMTGELSATHRHLRPLQHEAFIARLEEDARLHDTEGARLQTLGDAHHAALEFTQADFIRHMTMAKEATPELHACSFCARELPEGDVVELAGVEANGAFICFGCGRRAAALLANPGLADGILVVAAAVAPCSGCGADDSGRRRVRPRKKNQPAVCEECVEICAQVADHP